MADKIKQGSANITVSLPEFHQRKLRMMKEKLGIGNSGIIQRLIESQSIFTIGEQKENKENN